MSTLRKAAEAALEALEAGRDTPTSRAAIDALRAALAEPMTPAAWASPNEHGDLVTLWFSRSEAAAYCEEGEDPVPLYAAPPQPREPVRLTEEQIETMWRDEWDGFVSFEEAAVIVRDVEDAVLRAQGIET